VILADDALLFREGTARVLSEAGFDVTGQARNAAELLDLVHRDPPDIAVIDIRMPPGHSAEGIEAAAEIRRDHADVGLLLLSQHVDTHHAVRLITDFRTSVGYLLKDRVSDLGAFAADVRRVANGDCVLDVELVTRLVNKKRERDPLAELTDQERKVLALMAQGRSNSALSAELHLAGKTIEAHVRNIFTKLDLPPDPGGHRRVLAVLRFLRS